MPAGFELRHETSSRFKTSRNCTYAELNVHREIVQVGTDLLFDPLAASVGTKRDVGLNGHILLTTKGSLEDEFRELSTGFEMSVRALARRKQGSP